ncbi:putative protein kinase [Trypanosoma rangeli]|uniref:Uncharacterized protein n=1 Tax=Trypanosoma rangeli TaxID=5698 RepID=A0A3R7KJI1_TRYRA|nr:putative protein kinase [Trypanosoma rangeli]RNF07734.1 putative protein kinase [Trypanosoma rangeli]|eukprot:RNF07734.1 putative protein kinase [Trypanosoma rangeli]
MENNTSRSLLEKENNDAQGNFAYLLARIISSEEREALREKHIGVICCPLCHRGQERRSSTSSEASDKLFMDKPHAAFDVNLESIGVERGAQPRTDILWTLVKKTEHLEEQLARETQRHATFQQSLDRLQQQLKELKEEPHSQHQRFDAVDNTILEINLDALVRHIRPFVDLLVSEWSENILSKVNTMLGDSRRVKDGEIVLKPPFQASPLSLLNPQRAASLFDGQSHHNNGNNDHGENDGNSNDDAITATVPPKRCCTAFRNFSPFLNHADKLVLPRKNNVIANTSPDTQLLPSVRHSSIPSMHSEGILLKRSGNALRSGVVGGRGNVFNSPVGGSNVSFLGVQDFPGCSSFRKNCTFQRLAHLDCLSPIKSGNVDDTKTEGCYCPSVKVPSHFLLREIGENFNDPINQPCAESENLVGAGGATDDQQTNLHGGATDRKRWLPPPLEKDELIFTQNEMLRQQLQ